MTLEELDVPSVGGGGHRDHEVVNVGENQALGDGGVEGGVVDDKQEGRDRRALRGAHGDWSELSRRALKEESTLTVGEEAAHPGNDVPVHPFGPECRGELRGVDIVKAALDVEEEGGDLKVKALEEADLVGEGCGVIKCGETGKGASLVRVEEAAGSGEEGETGGGYPFHDPREGLQKHDDPEGGR